jgi:hypothetical protein
VSRVKRSSFLCCPDRKCRKGLQAAP